MSESVDQVKLANDVRDLTRKVANTEAMVERLFDQIAKTREIPAPPWPEIEQIRQAIQLGRLRAELRAQRNPWKRYHGNTVLLILLIALALTLEFTVLATVGHR